MQFLTSEKLLLAPLPQLPPKKLDYTTAKVVEELQKYEQSKKFEIEEIIIGLPLQMNGKMGMMADEVKLFTEALKKLISCPIKTWDERLTTVQAERSMREGCLTRKKRSKVVDTITATIILQCYLDSKPPSPDLIYE